MKKGKDFTKKVEEAMENLEKVVDEKVKPKTKGMEMPILVAMVVMILAGLSIKVLVFGLFVLALLLSPKYMHKLMPKDQKKAEVKKNPKKDEVAPVVEENNKEKEKEKEKE